MPVLILDAWASEGDYYTNGANFTVSAGSNRVAIVCISAEKDNGGAGEGAAITSVTLGGQTLTEVFDFYVGAETGFHNMNWVGYLNETQIGNMVGNSILVTWTYNPDPGTYDNSKAHWASYRNVDQANINSGSNSDVNTAATSLAPGIVDVDVDEKVIGFLVAGQPAGTINDPPATGWTRETHLVGAANGHVSGACHRTATTNDDTHNPSFGFGGSTRLAVAIMSLGFTPPSALEQEGYRFYDDGTESGSIARQLQDTVDSIARETTFQTRVILDATGDPPTQQYQLEYKEQSDASPEWRKVPLT